MIHQENVDALKRALEELILGKELPGWKCGCGCASAPAATAVSIRPGGEVYARQVEMPMMWTAQMGHPGSKDYFYSIGISQFLSEEKIEELFAKHGPLYTADAAAAV